MYKKCKAFIGVAILSLSLFVTPISLLVTPATSEGSVTVAVQPTVVYADGCDLVSSDGFITCIVDAFEFTVFNLSWSLASITGKFLDFFIEYSISSQTYSQGSDFVHNGWELVRDMANIFFIFVLLYIAIGTILNLDQVNTKKMLVKVIIVALLINFSLFFTKIVVDASNILARSFVGSIHLQDESGNELDSTDLSVALVAKFQPQELLNTEEGSPFYFQSQESPATAQFMKFVGMVIGAAVLIVMSWTFVTVGFLFLSRVITLWIAMITAPLAFISMVLPFNIPKFGHREWLKKLFESAFMAPVFLFFMYLIIMFLNLDFFSSVGLGGDVTDFVDSLLKIVVPFAIIMALVITASKLAKSMSGEIGSALSKVGGAVAGLGAAALTGGAAFAGRATLGAAGARLANSQRAGKMGRALGAKLESSSFDFRQGMGGKLIPKTPTGDMFSRKDGFKGARERAIRSKQEDAKRMEVNEFSNISRQLSQAKKRGDTEEEALLARLNTIRNGGVVTKTVFDKDGNAKQVEVSEKEATQDVNNLRNERYANNQAQKRDILSLAPYGKKAKQAARSRIRGGNKLKNTGDNAEAKTTNELLKDLKETIANQNNNASGSDSSPDGGTRGGTSPTGGTGAGGNGGAGPTAFGSSTVGDTTPKQRQQTPGDDLEKSSFSGNANIQPGTTINTTQPGNAPERKVATGFDTSAKQELQAQYDKEYEADMAAFNERQGNTQGQSSQPGNSTELLKKLIKEQKKGTKKVISSLEGVTSAINRNSRREGDTQSSDRSSGQGSNNTSSRDKKSDSAF
jgi:hypothetical protein